MSESTIPFKRFDVISFARTVLNEIEKIRSVPDNTDDAMGGKTVLRNESRLNAFFRLVGLPMFLTFEDTNENQSSGINSGMITPGYGLSFYEKFSLNKKIKNSNQDVDDRNNKLLDMENRIGTDEMNEKMVSALRDFMPLAANVSSATEFSKVSFSVSSIANTSQGVASASIGASAEAAFSAAAYEAAAAETTSKNIPQRRVYKKLKPLATAYINGDVLPFNSRIARPFLLNNEERKADGENLLPKPLIETIIRMRFNAIDSGDTANFVKGVQSYVSNDTAFEDIFKNGELLSGANALEQLVITEFLTSIQNLTKTWCKYESMRNSLYNAIPFNISIKTESSKQDVFGKRIYIDSSAILQSNTEYGIRLENARNKYANQEVLLSSLPTEDAVAEISSGTVNVALASLQTAFSSLISGQLEDTKNEINSIENEIKNKINTLEKIRVEVELLTGEFLGISIFDIIIVIFSLFLIDRESLFSLLDPYVIADIQKNDKLMKTFGEDLVLSAINNDINAGLAISKLEDIIDKLYDLVNLRIFQWKNNIVVNIKK